MKTRLLLACIIAAMPTQFLRRSLYRVLLGYRIDRSTRLAAFVVLVADKVDLRGARIEKFNVIRIGELTMEVGALIGKFNYITTLRRLQLGPSAMILHRNFIGGTFGTSAESGREELYLGARSQLSIDNFIDVSDRIIIGQDVVVAGARSQFWTHGFDHKRTRITGPIEIADNVFIGSATVIVQDVSICANVIVGAGSVVHRSISEPGLYASASLERKRQTQQ